MLVNLTETIVKERFAQGRQRIRMPYNILSTPRGDSISPFSQFTQKLKKCTRCALYARRNWAPVPPTGDFNSRVAVVGRCPTYKEGIEGVPFPNKTYRNSLLTEFMRIMGINREDTWLSNALFCDGGNKRPTYADVARCRWAKAWELSFLPRLSVMFLCGIPAIRSLTGLPYTHVSEVLGYTYETELSDGYTKRPLWLIPCLHPISLGWSQRELGKRVTEALASCVRDTLPQWLSSAGRSFNKDGYPKNGGFSDFSGNFTEPSDFMGDTSGLGSNKILLRVKSVV